MNQAQAQEIISDQKKEFDILARREYIIEREVLPDARRMLPSMMVKVVTGVRRCGKSVLCHQLLKDSTYGYANFDDERLRGMTAGEMNLLLKAMYQEYGEVHTVFFDEIQNIPGWELFVNRLHRLGMNVLVTGSNARLLSAELATHLTGRHLPIVLFPFSFREFLAYRKVEMKDDHGTKEEALLQRECASYLSSGGFPEAIKDPDLAHPYLTTLYSTILTKDVMLRQDIRRREAFADLAHYVLSQFSCPVTFHKLANIFGLKSSHTAAAYVSFLEDAYLVFTVSKYSPKLKEVQRAPKKVYGIDTGFLRAAAYHAAERSGGLFENAVALELRRLLSRQPLLQLSYWTDIAGREVDFVVRQGRTVRQLIQACTDPRDPDTWKREVTGLKKAGKELQCRTGLIITEDMEGTEKAGTMTIHVLPLWKWLLRTTASLPTTPHHRIGR